MFKFNSSINCIDLIPKDIANELKNQKIKTTINEYNVPVDPPQPTCDCNLTDCECDISNRQKKIKCSCNNEKCNCKPNENIDNLQTIILDARAPYLPPLVDTRKIKKEANCVPDPGNCSVIFDYEKSTTISIQPENQKDESFVLSGFENSNSSNKALLYPRVNETVNVSRTVKKVNTNNVKRYVAPPIIEGYGPSYNGNPIKRGMTMNKSYSCIKTQPLKCFNKISFGKKIM